MKYVQILILLLTSMFLYSSPSVSGVIDPLVGDEKYIEYAKNFTYVGRVYGITKTDEPYSASCVAINDHIILTAAHVFKDAKTILILINNKNLSVCESIPHPDFVHNKLGINDIAICKTDRSIELEWYPNLYVEKNEINKVCCIAGFGQTGTFSTGPKKTDGLRRAGSNKIEAISSGVLICDLSITENKTKLEFFISPGDSGGGLFIDNKLAGIHSYVEKYKPSDRSISAHTRISNHVEWINSMQSILLKESK